MPVPMSDVRTSRSLPVVVTSWISLRTCPSAIPRAKASSFCGGASLNASPGASVPDTFASFALIAASSPPRTPLFSTSTNGVSAGSSTTVRTRSS